MPIAFFAWGPQHFFLKTQNEDFRNMSKQKVGSAVIIANDSNADRFFAKYRSLFYTAKYPLVEEDSLGNFEYSGRVDKNSGLVKRMAIKYCLPFMVCKAFLNKIFEVTDIAEHKTLARIYHATLIEYKEKYDVENFVLVWTGTPEEYEKVKQVSLIPTYFFTEYERGPNFHPTAKGTKEIADFLFNQKILIEN